MVVCITASSIVLTGCHDGPLYALKHANPYYAMKEWKTDEALGATDHERRNQLIKLSKQIGDMPTDQQAMWSSHLRRIFDTDPSSEMRRLAISAAGNLKTAAAIPIIQKGLDDENTKVRMEACRALGKRREANAVQLLAATAGKASDQDVKHAALTAIGKHKGRIPVDSLRLALNDRDPATQNLAINALRSVTGKNFGDSPDAWIKALGPGMAPAGAPPQLGDVQIATQPSATSPSGGSALSMPTLR